MYTSIGLVEIDGLLQVLLTPRVSFPQPSHYLLVNIIYLLDPGLGRNVIILSI
jgi:hypothetical protein